METKTTHNKKFSLKESASKLIESATKHIGQENLQLINKHKFHIFGAVLIAILSTY
jgi:hypothetical protein